MEMKLSYKMRSKICQWNFDLNELGKDYKLIQFIESKVPVNHFGENIHGNILNHWPEWVYLDKGYTTVKDTVKVNYSYNDIQN
jgi:ribonuclease-3